MHGNLGTSTLKIEAYRIQGIILAQGGAKTEFPE